MIVFGLEGGLVEEEIIVFCEYKFVLCSLGLRILRIEMVLLYVLSVVLYYFELMGWWLMLIVVFYMLGCKVNYYEIEVIW